MVKAATLRTKQYSDKNNETLVYLTIKALKRARFVNINKVIGVQTLKDEAIIPILDSYSLNTRQRRLAIEAWRKLYFKGYNNQSVAIT